MNQPSPIFNLFDDQYGECPQCGSESWQGSLCRNCENERKRMAEFDELLNRDADLRRVWVTFRDIATERAGNGSKRLTSMPILYEARYRTGLEVSNSHAPMMARRFNQIAGHEYFKTHKLKGGK